MAIVVGRRVDGLGRDRGHVGVDVQLAEGPGHRHPVVPVADVVATADLVDVDRWERGATAARLGEADPAVTGHGERRAEPSVEGAVDAVDGAHDPVDRDGGHAEPPAPRSGLVGERLVDGLEPAAAAWPGAGEASHRRDHPAPPGGGVVVEGVGGGCTGVGHGGQISLASMTS